MLQCGTNDDKQLKIELLSQWKLEAEFCKNLEMLSLVHFFSFFIFAKAFFNIVVTQPKYVFFSEEFFAAPKRDV